MPTVKCNCIYMPPPCDEFQLRGFYPDSEIQPSWVAGLEALDAYHRWVNAVVLPVAFQWIEEHKPEVYAAVPEELKSDVGVAIEAAFRLVKELPAYKLGLEKRAGHEAARAEGRLDPSKTNPVWSGIVKKVRASTDEAFAEQSQYLGEFPRE